MLQSIVKLTFETEVNKKQCTMNSLKRMTCLLAMISFSFFACEGPAGPAGDIGPQGPAGPQGPQGDEGNANVKISIFTVYDWEWAESNTAYWSYNKYVSIITSEIANSGVVLVFVKSTNSEHWQSLPYTWPGTYEKILRYWYTTNYLEINIYSEYDSYEPTSTYRFKVAAIAGEIVDNAKKGGVNLNDYDQFKDYFKIE